MHNQIQMGKKDKRIDDYIGKAQDFAKPILRHIREIVHEACPEAEETIKWGSPHFMYDGKILCAMASFKAHCAFFFRLGSVMKDPKQVMTPIGSGSGMGHFGKITNLSDLPSDKILIQYIKEAMRLTEEGVKKTARKVPRKELEVPDYLIKALRKDKEAFNNFQKFSYSHKRDYVEWITEAKTEPTRERRIATAIQWLREGKGRNWKYEK